METHFAAHVNKDLWILKDCVKVRESFFGLTKPAVTCSKLSLKLVSQARNIGPSIFKLLSDFKFKIFRCSCLRCCAKKKGLYHATKIFQDTFVTELF